ncbi:tyrosine-type recombinase/integrase [Dongia sp.]|uniref:tyrosine-type recombinase/integrase n=1 Tax=Dongia sp. TaxID=1977262 RepID=UPI0035B4EDDB
MSDENEQIAEGLYLYRRPDSPVWQARIKGPDGWGRFSTGETDKAKAKTAAIKRMGKVEGLGEAGKSLKTPRFKAVAQLYIEQLDALEKAGSKKAIHGHYRMFLRKWITPFFGEKRIDKIDHETMLEWEAWRLKENDGKKHSKSTVNAFNVVLREVFAIARRKKWINVDQIPELKNNGRKTEARDWFEGEEKKQLMTALQSYMNTGHTSKTKAMRTLLYYYVRIMLASGVRPGAEIEGLQWQHVDLRAKSVSGKPYVKLTITKGKTKKVREVVARIDAKVFEEIAKFTGHTKKADYVFTLPDGERPHRWSDCFHDLLVIANLKFDNTGNARTLYSLRHTYCTESLIAETAVEDVAANMGTSIKMISDFYSKLKATHKADQLMRTKPEELADRMTVSTLDEWM